MIKNVLVIGGTYFVGRVFMLMAARSDAYSLHTVNRGTRPLNLSDVRQHVCDRHDAAKLKAILPSMRWDVVIDFCAYEPGEIDTLFEGLFGNVGKYICISTCSVYEPSPLCGEVTLPAPKSEEHPLIAHDSDDPGLHYAYNKRVLEDEAVAACARAGAALIILRPSFVYGPLNYAPREAFYFQHMLEETAIPHPYDATGRFQCVHVKDIGKIIMGCIDNHTLQGVYNLAAPEIVDYATLVNVLQKIKGSALTLEPVSVAQVYAQSIPLPFPLDWDELYEGTRIVAELGMDYVSFEEGMRETYDIYVANRRK